MKTLLEQLNKQELRKVSEIPGVKGLPISDVLMSQKGHEERRRAITGFFGDRRFTYESFANIVRPETVTFRLEDRRLIRKFASKKEGKTKSGEIEIWYDEYIETFFIYLYYQLFVKLFTMADAVVANNKENIENAKKILAGIKDPGLVEVVKENIVNVYKVFYSSVIPVGNPSTIESSKDAQLEYFEDFVNKNISLFFDYPMSGQMEGFSTDNIKQFMDELFDVTRRIDIDNKSNRQLVALKILSNMIEGGKPSFDFVELQELIQKYPTVTDSKVTITFPTAERGKVEDAFDTLSSFKEFERIGMGWAIGTQWEPFISLVCGIISMQEISDAVKKLASQTKAKTSEYVRLLDTDETDEGVFFINNDAFMSSVMQIDSLKKIPSGIDRILKNVFEKSNYFQGLSGSELVKALFVTYDAKYTATDVSDLSQEDKDVLEKIMKITGIMDVYGTTLNDVIANINKALFDLDYPGKPGLPELIVKAEEYARRNTGDVKLDDVDTSAFSPTSVVKNIAAVSSATASAFKKIFSGDFSIENIADSFNQSFSTYTGFAKMNVESDGSVTVNIGTQEAIRLKSKEQIKEYIMFMSSSMGSILYHTKFMFGGPDSERPARFKEYFNVLTWFLQSLKDAGKDAAFSTEEYPLSWKITPYTIDFIKYALRAFVNDCHNIINSSVKDQINDSHKKEKMDDAEWKSLSSILSEELESYLRDKVK